MLSLYEVLAPMAPMPALVACALTGMAGIALSIGFLLAEPRAPTAWALSILGVAAGLTIATHVPLIHHYEATGSLHFLLRYPVFDAVLMVAGGAWLMRIAVMAGPSRRRVRVIATSCVAAIWVASATVFALAIQFPVERVTQFVVCMGRPEGCDPRIYWMFTIPWSVFFIGLFVGAMVLFEQGVDPAEKVRAAALAVSVPFFAGIPNLPAGYNAVCGMFGILILSNGLIRYHSMLGARAQFLSRFLSPEIGALVAHRGLDRVVRPRLLDITVVSCDLRGFTRLSQLLASDQVVRLLEEYYVAVGQAVAAYGGTIKDYAGDGVLILVGAPIPVADHPQRGLALARRLLQVDRDLISHWAGPELELGMGVGVASGKVTVGAIGRDRMEYTAVGPAVNIAARLCGQARDGEICVLAETAMRAGVPVTASECRTAPLKGLSEVSYVLLAPSDAEGNPQEVTELPVTGLPAAG
jgi:adenylate cyclase